MVHSDLIKKTASYVRLKQMNEHTGHDWFHTERVWNMARHLQAKEGGDLSIVELLALLHDVGDTQNYEFESKKGSLVLRGMLDVLDVDKSQQDIIIHTIGEMKYKADETRSPSTLEGKIVQDADFLDSLGAIGIARVFATGGNIKRVLHNPVRKPRRKLTHDDYIFRKQEGTSYNYFLEKILKIPEYLNTATAKKIAEKRVRFIKEFIKEFDEDWTGIK